MNRVAVLGLAVAGSAVARALHARGVEVVLADDAFDGSHARLAEEIDAPVVDMGTSGAVEELLDGVDTLIPAPGVPPRHLVIATAINRGVTVRTEIDVAYEWESRRPGGPRPIVGITGTDGKTTTTMLTGALLRASGIDALEVGNTDVPFMAAVDESVDAFVVECSSFRLAFTPMFRCISSAWLNFAPDHLDWHGTLDEYAAAKARLWKNVRTSDVVVAPSTDHMIRGVADSSGARVVTFGGSDGDYRVEGGELVGPTGSICAVTRLRRSMPHDIANALAAIAVLDAPGLVSAASSAVVSTVESFEPPHHRIELVGEFAGSRWFNDSKATSPHAALTAIRAFDRIVLIAGGRNKDLDLSQMASEPERMEAVVAIGDDGALIEEAFRDVCPVSQATSMREAVAMAASLARPGIDVLLSPGCTSYDWYANYGERGNDYTNSVKSFFANGAGR